eukprot:627919-Amphidinium_carterae.1
MNKSSGHTYDRISIVKYFPTGKAKGADRWGISELLCSAVLLVLLRGTASVFRVATSQNLKVKKLKLLSR